MFQTGDKVKVKNLPHLNKAIVGLEGEVTKWHYAEVYTVWIDGNFFVLLAGEMEKL